MRLSHLDRTIGLHLRFIGTELSAAARSTSFVCTRSSAQNVSLLSSSKRSPEDVIKKAFFKRSTQLASTCQLPLLAPSTSIDSSTPRNSSILVLLVCRDTNLWQALSERMLFLQKPNCQVFERWRNVMSNLSHRSCERICPGSKWHPSLMSMKCDTTSSLEKGLASLCKVDVQVRSLGLM